MESRTTYQIEKITFPATYTIDLSKEEYQLIRRLRQLRNQRCAMLLVELLPQLRWRAVGKAEG